MLWEQLNFFDIQLPPHVVDRAQDERTEADGYCGREVLSDGLPRKNDMLKRDCYTMENADNPGHETNKPVSVTMVRNFKVMKCNEARSKVDLTPPVGLV